MVFLTATSFYANSLSNRFNPFTVSIPSPFQFFIPFNSSFPSILHPFNFSMFSLLQSLHRFNSSFPSILQSLQFFISSFPSILRLPHHSFTAAKFTPGDSTITVKPRGRIRSATLLLPRKETNSPRNPIMGPERISTRLPG